MVAKLKFLGMTLTYWNCRHEEMSSRLNFWKGGREECLLLFSSAASILPICFTKSIKSKMYRAIILSVFV